MQPEILFLNCKSDYIFLLLKKNVSDFPLFKIMLHGLAFPITLAPLLSMLHTYTGLLFFKHNLFVPTAEFCVFHSLHL